MAKPKTENKLNNCPSCGAPIVSEICAYCGSATGLNTSEADMEYPVLECKEVTISFWTICFPMIFAGAFGIIGFVMLMLCLLTFESAMLLLIAIPFILVGIAALTIVLRTVLRYVKVKTRGKIIQGTVYGYIDDDFTINGQPAQIVKLLVQTSNGPRFILYKLGNTLKRYGIYDEVDIMVYKNYFMICKNKEVIKW